MAQKRRCSIPKFDVIPSVSWSATVILCSPLMLTMAFMLLYEVASGQQMWNPRNLPVRHDLSFHCENDPRCICVSNSRVSRLCEGKINIFQSERSGVETYTMQCRGEAEIDPYHYLSMVRPGMKSNLGVNLTIRGCPPPSRSYSELIKAREVNESGNGEYLPVLSLEINCSDSKTFQLMSRHLRGLELLRSLKMSCPKLYNVSAELLSEIKVATSIEISNTLIETFPERFFSNFSPLKQLFLTQNRLRTIHASLLAGLQDLTVLDMSLNMIESIDDDIFMSTMRLAVLDIGGNFISKLPSSLCSLSNLKELKAENNRIDAIPQTCLLDLVSLKYLELYGNRLLSLEHGSISLNEITSDKLKYERVDPNMHDLNKTLNELSMSLKNTSREAFVGVTFPSSNRISKLTGEARKAIFSGVHIVKLNLRNNLITSLPAYAFFGLKELEELDLSCNNITSLHPDIFFQNKILRILRASDNLITEVPEMLLKSNDELRALDFSGNHVKTLGSAFFRNITRLNIILLQNNRIDFLPRDIFKPFDVKLVPERVTDETHLELNLDGNLLESIPDLTLPRLTELRLSRNRLAYVEADVLEHVPHLRVLDISQNLIKSLGGPIQSPGSHSNESRLFFSGHLNKLTTVDLSGNQLSSFPNLEFVHSTLKFLNLSGNQIPGFVSQCGHPYSMLRYRYKGHVIESALETLDLSNNSFTWKWRSLICGWEHAVFGSIRHLNLSRNRLNLTHCRETMVPMRGVYGCLGPFMNLRSLKVIILSHNDLHFVPMEFQHFLPKLRLVDLSYNRIKRLWHHDFLITNGLTAADLRYLHLDASQYVKRTSADGETYYEFSNAHHLTIDLRHNDINSVVLEDDKIRVVRQDCERESQYSRASIYLGGNPIICGCGVFKLLQYSLKEIRPISEMEKNEGQKLVLPAAIDIQDLHCSKPNSVSGKAVSEPDTWTHHLLPLMGLCLYQDAMLLSPIGYGGEDSGQFDEGANHEGRTN